VNVIRIVSVIVIADPGRPCRRSRNRRISHYPNIVKISGKTYT